MKTKPRHCICEQCGKEFDHPVRRTRFCSMKCSRRSYYKKNYTASPYPGLNTGAIGAASECKVIADLILKGYEVFRAISSMSSCDLAILRNGKLLRVEVRTGRPSKNRKMPFWAKPKRHLSDVFALVLPDHIIYRPPLL
jgi:PD-(D/E)XK endonuclease